MKKDSYKFLEEVIRTADDSFAKDIVAFDMKGLSIMSDYNVVATASNKRLLNAIASKITQMAIQAGVENARTEGKQDADWLLIDLGDVIVHLFVEDERDHYQLEDLWIEAPQLDLTDWITENDL